MNDLPQSVKNLLALHSLIACRTEIDSEYWHVGKRGGRYTLFVPIGISEHMWVTKIMNAVDMDFWSDF